MPPNIQSKRAAFRYETEPDLRALICVREPYFALKALKATDREVQASISVEQPLGRERGIVAAAEAGRHLAILGACALAQVNPVRERHYYLATDATLTCLDEPALAETEPLCGRATASFESKRRGRAECVLFLSDGAPLFALEVGYAVLTESVFERLFASARDETQTDPTSNPHSVPLPLTGLTFHGSRASFLLPRLEASLCTGHFDGYPLLPVAIVMRTLSDLAGALLGEITEDPDLTYTVKDAEVEAHNFAKPGEALLFEAEYARSHAPGQDSFVCQASVPGGAPIGTLRLVLDRRAKTHSRLRPRARGSTDE